MEKVVSSEIKMEGEMWERKDSLECEEIPQKFP